MKSWLYPLVAVLFALVFTVGSVLAEGEVSLSMIERWNQELDQNPAATPLINAVSNNDLRSVALNRDLVRQYDGRFNFELEGSKIIDQKSSGRCWMFAGTNVVAPLVMKKLDMDDFKLSQAFMAFWDKVEKSNLFLETVIDKREAHIHDRALQDYLDSPLGDGGWYQYFESLIAKHGIVPASAMPETYHSPKTSRLNTLLKTLLRKAAADLRAMHRDGKKVKQLRQKKEEYLGQVYRILVHAYGHPPGEFTFRYEKEVDDSTKVWTESSYTPLGFYQEYFEGRIPQFVSLSHNPAREFDKLYKFDGGRNTFEVDDLVILNMSLEKIKQYTLQSLLDSQFVWFACDVGKEVFRDSGMMIQDIYQYDQTFGVDFTMSKADRLDYNEVSPGHAMALIGVDTLQGRARKWKVENSWGTKAGSDGYFTMYDNWFDEYVLMVMIDRARLSEEDARLMEQEPVIVEDWEPFYKAMTRIE